MDSKMVLKKVLVWKVPFFAQPSFVHVNSDAMPLYDEFLVISPTLSVLFNGDKPTPNRNLKKFGGILAKIQGEAMIFACDPETGANVDIPENFLENLRDILRKDEDARRMHFEDMWTGQEI